ncbi:AAA family ATPase [Pelagibius sp. CAU 1746]|uniref:ATP-binding protein n=1 Tax=Pelagibius sp. CAU 1746 TaxID=3140370 RepID=UPI00325B6949
MTKPPAPLGIDELPLSQKDIDTLQKICRNAGKQANQFCLFSGPSGTGKTMVAAVMANELERPLQRMKLGAVVGKSAGETAENLTALFAKAQEAEAVLFFDEADALFGRRSEVQDSHDRFANQEVGHLLEALAAYRGLVILSSNRKAEAGSPVSACKAHRLTFARQDD